MLMKWLLIIQSMSPLFLLLAIRSYPKSYISVDAKILFFTCCVWMIAALYAYIVFCAKKKFDFKGPYEIKILDDVSKGGLDFVLTLILPLLIQVPDNRHDSIFFIVLLCLIIILLAKTKRWIANPVLLVLGYKIYKIEFENNKDFSGEVYAVTKKKISPKQEIDYTNIDKNLQTIFARRIK